MQVRRIQPEIETALKEVARGRKGCHVTFSQVEKKALSDDGGWLRGLYGGWECEIKATDRPPAKGHKTAAT